MYDLQRELENAYDNKIKNLKSDLNDSDNHIYKDIILKSLTETENSLNLFRRFKEQINDYQKNILLKSLEFDEIEKAYRENQEYLRKQDLTKEEKQQLNTNEEVFNKTLKVANTAKQFDIDPSNILETTLSILTIRFIGEILLSKLDTINPAIFKKFTSKILSTFGVGLINANDIKWLIELDKTRSKFVKSGNMLMNYYCDYLEVLGLWKEMIKRISVKLSESQF
jgi:hypothetical protein